MRICFLKMHAKMKKDIGLIESFVTVGGILLLFGAAVYITGWDYAPYLYLAGSVLFACGQFADRYQGTDKIMKRLRGQQVLGACFLLLTAALMFTDGLHDRLLTDTSLSDNIRSFLLTVTRRNNWILTLSIGAIFELYSSFRMDSISKQSK